jgi:hypothetical protein
MASDGRDGIRQEEPVLIAATGSEVLARFHHHGALRGQAAQRTRCCNEPCPT